MICRWATLVCLVLLPVALQAGDDSLVRRHAELSGKFIAQLEALAAKCDELGMAPQAERTREIIAPRQSGRIVLFVAEQDSAKRAQADGNERVRQWREKLASLRAAYADSLYALSLEAAADQQGQLALRLMYEVLRENPDHLEAKRLLGFSRRVMRSVKPRAPSGDHREFGWRGGRYWELDSRHFHIESNLSAAACQELAGELEQLHDVWLQLFYPVWAKDEIIAGRFAGQEEIDLIRPRRFRVVLFKDRDEYLRQLSKTQKNVGVSSGIYFDEQKVSILAGGADAKKSTWFHEITHQLFQEYLEAPTGVAKERNIWMVESVAQFMESLVLKDGCATLGGYDADSLQFARFRTRGGDFRMPLAQLTALGREPLQEHADIRRIYSQMAGLGHFFMEGRQGELRYPFLKTLLAVYQGRDEADTLIASLGKSVSPAADLTYEALDQQYYDFLDVTDEMIARTPPNPAIRGLSLRKTSVTDAGLAAFSRCDKLQWVDLSLTAAGDQGVAAFPASKELTTLFLEHTRISDAGVEHTLRFPALEELYLSGSSITDDGASKLAGLKKLRILDLSGCPLTDACLPALASLKQLETLDTSGTRISRDSLAKLKRSLPKLKESPAN